MKTYIALVRDHSGSMRSLRNGAANDFNLTIDGIKTSIQSDPSQSAYVSVVECGVGYRGEVRTQEINRPLSEIKHLTTYHADGGSTPLWDSVDAAIGLIERNIALTGTAYLVMVITDGHENSSRTSASALKAKIARLQATDKWTFVFRVPKGHKHALTALGIPEGNIMEWEQTEKDLVRSTGVTVSAVSTYFQSRSTGKTSSTAFYADISSIPLNVVASNMNDVTNQVNIIPVWPLEDGMQIRDFCNKRLGKFLAGRACYQLTKSETVQPYKTLVIRDQITGKVYEGGAARSLLGLPSTGEIKLRPGKTGNYDVFVQSNSVNRKMQQGTSMVYLNR
jgi:hypothetical protein